MPLQVQKTTEYVQEDGLPTEEECNAPPIDSSLTESVQVAEITRSATEMQQRYANIEVQYSLESAKKCKDRVRMVTAKEMMNFFQENKRKSAMRQQESPSARNQ